MKNVKPSKYWSEFSKIEKQSSEIDLNINSEKLVKKISVLNEKITNEEKNKLKSTDLCPKADLEITGKKNDCCDEPNSLEKMKEYFKDLKGAIHKIPQKDKTKKLIQLLKDLFSSQVSLSLLEKCLNEKHKVADKISNVAGVLLDLITHAPKGLSGTIASYVTHLFRKKNNIMGRFVVDLDGLETKYVDQINDTIQNLFLNLINMLEGNQDLLAVIKILDSLKWIFRGRESKCVTVLNLREIYLKIDTELRKNSEVQGS